jgi:hypothetical protein
MKIPNMFPDDPEKGQIFERFVNLYEALFEVYHDLTYDTLLSYHASDTCKPYPKEVYDILYEFRNECAALRHKVLPVQWYALRKRDNILLSNYQHAIDEAQKEKDKTDAYFVKTAEDTRQFNLLYPAHIKRTVKPIHYNNETIIITDPCYLTSGHQKDLDYSNFQPTKPYIYASTLYGDWSCHVLLNTDEFKGLDEAMDIYRHDWMYPLIRYGNLSQIEELSKRLAEFVLGQFCADSCQVIICSLADALNFNPDFEKFIQKHHWCVTKIEKFTGDVLYHKVNCDTCYLEGVGNIPFITRQTGL